MGVQLPLLWGWVKPVPAQAWLQLHLGGCPGLCSVLEVAGAGLKESQTHSCFVVVIHTDVFKAQFSFHHQEWSSLSCLE